MAGSNTPRDSKRTIEHLETTPRQCVLQSSNEEGAGEGAGTGKGKGAFVSVLIPHSLDEGRGGGGRVGPVGDDALAAAGEEEGVAHLAEGLPVVGVDRRLRAAAQPAAGEGGERRREHREAAEIHGVGGEEAGRAREISLAPRSAGRSREVGRWVGVDRSLAWRWEGRRWGPPVGGSAGC